MADQTYFEIFDLPKHLQIDTAALETAFYRLSRKLHPDRFAAKPAADQDAALAAASTLNDAYPHPCAIPSPAPSICSGSKASSSKSSPRPQPTLRAHPAAQKKQTVPPELLEEVFELNMQLAEMRAAKQMGEDDPQLRRDLEIARTGFDAKMAETQRDLEALWRQWDRSVDDSDRIVQTSARDGMVVLLNKRTYLRNLVRDVNEGSRKLAAICNSNRYASGGSAVAPCIRPAISSICCR